MADKLATDLASLRIDRDAPPPRRGWIVALLVVVALAGGAALGARELAPSIFKTEVAVTEISLVSPAQQAIELTATGYVVPQRQAKVSCKLLGRIEKMHVKEGDRVKAGALLYEVDDASQRSAVSGARSRLFAARARALSARGHLAEERQQLEREELLKKNDVMPASTPDDHKVRVTSLEEDVKAADCEVEAAQEELKAREVELGFTTVTAPFDGLVVGKPLDPGELVGTFNEKPAVERASLESLLVEVDVPEARLAKARLGAPCEVVLDAFSQKRHRGIVVELGSRVNRAKATLIAKVKLVDAPELLLPEMAARVSFLEKELEASSMNEPPKLFAPRAAVTERGGAKVVFLVEDGRVRSVPVAIAAPFGAGFELKSGPPPGSRVVADPPETLADGQKVKEKTN
ncbi:efflux RND transporter periplasmic adaptor subunit [bacterium]|nr:efflux RND transporter periplasmic adaptor subunit [bacterium]